MNSFHRGNNVSKSYVLPISFIGILLPFSPIIYSMVRLVFINGFELADSFVYSTSNGELILVSFIANCPIIIREFTRENFKLNKNKHLLNISLDNIFNKIVFYFKVTVLFTTFSFLIVYGDVITLDSYNEESVKQFSLISLIATVFFYLSTNIIDSIIDI